ncbi:MAG: hypothetical protein U1E51_21295 [Candidatus Binatia bacterium]|nr:hypothetical protein [Candidatus Binatia bacterium]
MSISLSIAEIKRMYGIESTLELCRRIQNGSVPQPVQGGGPPRWDREEVEQAVARDRKGGRVA